MSTALKAFPGWYIEFQAALLRQAPRPGEIDQTTAEEWTNNQKGLKKNLAGCLLPQTPVVTVEMDKPELLLDLVGTVTVPATTSQFVAKEKFVINTGDDTPVKISYLSCDFDERFLDGDGKIEGPISEQMLSYHKLRRSSGDGPIIAELGGAERSETTLFEVFTLMEKQRNGEYGVLLNDGSANLFYVKDRLGVLCAVDVDFCDGGWGLGADSLEVSQDREVIVRVFSRNSVLESSEPSAPAQVPSGASAT